MPIDSVSPSSVHYQLTLILVDFDAELDASILETCTSLFHEHKVAFMRLPILEPSVCQWSLGLSDESQGLDLESALRQRLAPHSAYLNILFRVKTSLSTTIKLIVFDMDSTLIQQEVLDEMAAVAGPEIESRVKSITERSMRGELDFESSLRERVALFSGQSTKRLFDAVKSRITLTPGALEFTQYCREKNIRMAICSGGFFPMIQCVQDWLHIHLAYGNNFETRINDQGDTLLTGAIQGHLFAAADKKATLIQLASELNVDLDSETMAVGDGANDLPMLTTAALGIAYNAKPIVKKKASYAIDCSNMKCLQYLVD